MSDRIPTVHEAWARVMRDVGGVAKKDRNQAQGFNFRGIDAVVNAVGPAMRSHGVFLVPQRMEAQYRDIEVGKNRSAMRECTISATYRVFGPGGDWFDTQVVGESMDSGDKGTAKAASIALRILLLQSLMIPTDEPDPDSVSHERAAPPRQTSGAPHTPGDHEDQRARALIASHTKRWTEAGDQWRVDELKRRRDAAGWPQALLEYERAQLAAAVSACVAIDKLDGPQGPQEPQDGPGEAEPPDGSARSMQGEGEAVAPTTGDVSTRSDAVSSAEPAAAPKPAGRRKA